MCGQTSSWFSCLLQQHAGGQPTPWSCCYACCHPCGRPAGRCCCCEPCQLPAGQLQLPSCVATAKTPRRMLQPAAALTYLLKLHLGTELFRQAHPVQDDLLCQVLRHLLCLLPGESQRLKLLGLHRHRVRMPSLMADTRTHSSRGQDSCHQQHQKRTCARVSTTTALSTASFVALLAKVRTSSRRPGSCCCAQCSKGLAAPTQDSRLIQRTPQQQRHSRGARSVLCTLSLFPAVQHRAATRHGQL